MKNKFLNGARLAGVMLALVLLGTSAAWAAETVTINLGEIRSNAGTSAQLAPDADGIRTGNLIGVWPKGKTLTQINADGVKAECGAWTVYTTTPAAGYYGWDLKITLGANVEKVIVTGTLPTASGNLVRVKKIAFTGGTTNAVVEWDGGVVTGQAANAATAPTGNQRPGDVEAFLSWETSAGVLDETKGIHLYSGSITASSKYILKNVGEQGATDALVRRSNIIGNPVAAKALDNLTIVHKGREAAFEIAYGAFATSTVRELISINPPNKGNYTITADSVALRHKTPDAGLIIIGNTENHGGGVLSINGWAGVTTAAASANSGATIRAGSVKVNGNGQNTKLVVIGGKGKQVISAKGALNLVDVEIQHAAPAGTTGASALSTDGTVTLTKVVMTNGATSGNIAGFLVSAGSHVKVENGRFYPTANPKGTAIITQGNVDIIGAKISATGAATALGYVVESTNGTVTLKSTPNDEAAVTTTMTGTTVGGISSYKAVVIETSGKNATVSAAGNGNGIYVKLIEGFSGGEVVTLKGNASASVYVSVANGQAVLVDDKSAERATANHATVTIKDAIISRSGTTSTTPLVEVQNGNIWIEGTTTDRMKLTAGSHFALWAAKNINLTGEVDGGQIVINGGNIAGTASGAVYGQKVNIEQWKEADGGDDLDPYVTDGFGTKNTVITATGGVAISAIEGVVINNGFASVFHSGTVADDRVNNKPAAAIYSLEKDIKIWNVDSIRSFNATTLLTVEPKQGVTVTAGKVRSTASLAINSAGNVKVDWCSVNEPNNPAWDAGLCPAVQNDAAFVVEGEENGAADGGEDGGAGEDGNLVEVGNKHNKIEISSNGSGANVSAIYAPYPVEGPTVIIGDAKIIATGQGGASAIVVNKGNVVVDSKDAWIQSATGNGVKVQDANVKLKGGDIKSDAPSGTYAGIWVINGNADVGVGNEDVEAWRGMSNVTSNGSLAVFLDGLGAKTVTVDYTGVLTVKGANATAGMIRVTKDNKVAINANAHLISTGAQAFAIEAEDGQVNIAGGKIVSQKSKQAISTKGGDIIIGGSRIGGEDRDIDANFRRGTRITGDEGVLVRAIKSARTGRAGDVVVTGGFIYNKYGTGIKADDSLFIIGGEIVTDKDTAVTAGTATTAGLVEIQYPAHVWAAAQYAKANPVAVAARMIRMKGGLVEANTIKSSADNTSTYPDSKATGLLLKKGPGEPVFKVTNRDADALGHAKAEGVNGERGQTSVIAHGANTAIDCQDSSVTLEIVADAAGGEQDSFRISVNGDNLGSEILYLPGKVSIKAGDNGIAIKSVGEIKVEGTEITEESKAEGEGLGVGVYIATGSGVNARAITMPVPANSNKHKDLTLFQGFVEAGSDGAIAIDATSKAIVRVGASVVLARHLSTGINGQGGVYIDSGYVEILATENNNVGTAVTGRNIRISGGQGDDDETAKSEIHSKGIAVKDAIEGATVQVTGTIHMSGTVASNLKVGASVQSDTGNLTMGSERSRNLWRLSTYSLKTDEIERGKALTIPAGVTIEVGDNGSRLGAERYDTIKVAGTVTTVGRQAGARFENSGRVIVEKGGNVKFNKTDPASFKNSYGSVNGIIVLKTGSLLDDSVLVHDTGKFSEKKYTFLKWAKILSGDTAYAIGSRGDGNVVVPPMYATLYGNQRVFVDEEDMDEDETDFWTATSSRSDSVYTAKFIKYPLDRRYKPYFETEDFLAKGDFLLGGTGTVKVDDDGTVLLTEAGTFNRIATMTNEAGVGTKTYTHVVNRVDLNRIIQNQTESPQFFDGYFYNNNRRVVGRDGEDTVLVYEGGVQVKYTGSTAKLLDGIKGAVVEGYTDLSTDKPIYYEGLGVHTFWYRGVEDTYYPLTSNVPTNVGTYQVLASFAQGNNFVAVPADDRSIVPIGTVEVVEGDIVSVFGKKDNESYQLLVDLEAKVAKSGVKAYLPSVLRFGAVYDNENIEISGPGDAALVGAPTLPDSILTFSVNANSNVGDYIEFKVTIRNTAEPANLEPELKITVRVRFLSKEDMKEAKPSYITVNYRNERLTGLLVGTTYTINGETLVATSADTTIKEDWVGTTLSVVALPAATSYKTQSDVAQIVIGTRPAVTDSLRAVAGDEATTGIAIDGRLRNTSTSMEYKLQSDTTWKPAGAVVTTGLKAGVYEVRLAPTTSSFPSAAVTVTIGARDGVAEAAREIPVANATAEAAIAPVARVTAAFSAGPSPVSKNAGKVSFFSSKAVKSGSLYIFDASGNTVAKVKAKSGSKEIASWNLKDKKGAVVATGSYVVKGKLVGKDGKAETVSAIFSVAK